MHWPSSLKIDQEYLLSSGSYMQRLKMYPYFDFAHYAMVCSSTLFKLIIFYFRCAV